MKRNKKLIKFLTLIMTCGILTSLTTISALAYDGSEAAVSPAPEESTIVREDGISETQETNSNAFSVEGNGTLIDESDSSQNKLFYIVTTTNGNNFYLIIDKDSSSNNVYMLSAIDEADLADFVDETDSAEGSSLTSTPSSKDTDGDIDTLETDETLADPTGAPDEEAKTADTKESDSKGSAGKYVGFLLLALACVGVIAAYYFLKIRNRDDQEEEDETAYGEDEQPDDADDTEAEEIEEAEDSEDVETDLPTGDTDVTESGNTPFVDYPDPEDFPETEDKTKS